MIVYLSDTKYQNKPNSVETSMISNTILDNEFVFNEVRELAEKLGEGHAVLLSNQKTKSQDISKQFFLMLDFDNKYEKYSLKDLEEDSFMQKHASFYYRTFNDGKFGLEKFRVVFKLDEPLTSHKQVEDAYRILFQKYPQADTSVGQATRLFFGGNKGYTEINFNNTLTLDIEKDIAIINKFEQDLITLDTPNHLLLKYSQYDLVKEKLGANYSQKFDDNESATTYFNSLDIKELLELPDDNPFIDILHEESNPSASVYFSEEHNIYFYKCFSENHRFVGDIVALLSRYLKKDSLDILLLLIDITNSEMVLDNELAKKRYSTKQFQKGLMSGTLESTYPELFYYTKRYRQEINATLNLILDSVYTDNEGNTQFVNYYSVEKLAKKVSYMIERKVTVNKMKSVLNLIVVTEIINKLEEQKVPRDLYNKIIEPQRKQIENGKVRQSNFLSTEGFDEYMLENMESIAKVMKENNITVSSLGYQIVYRTFGEEKAMKDFPQAYKPLEEKGLIKMSKDNKNLTSKQMKYEKDITTILLSAFNDKQYIFEDTVITLFAKKNRMKKLTANDIYKKMRADIYSKYDLDCKRCNKDLHSKLNVSEKFSNKNIIFKS